jgi:hypothetical protein
VSTQGHEIVDQVHLLDEKDPLKGISRLYRAAVRDGIEGRPLALLIALTSYAYGASGYSGGVVQTADLDVLEKAGYLSRFDSSGITLI